MAQCDPGSTIMRVESFLRDPAHALEQREPTIDRLSPVDGGRSRAGTGLAPPVERQHGLPSRAESRYASELHPTATTALAAGKRFARRSMDVWVFSGGRC
jgi:hypothetical protein